MEFYYRVNFGYETLGASCALQRLPIKKNGANSYTRAYCSRGLLPLFDPYPFHKVFYSLPLFELVQLLGLTQLNWVDTIKSSFTFIF